MRFSLACYELADPSKGTTVNPGIIAGGTATNVIPDSCEVRFDLRYCFDKDGSDLENQIFELAERSWAPGVSQTVELLGFTPAMPLSDDAKALTAKITEAAKMTGFEAKFVDAGGGSDGNRIAKAGIPVIDGCGPAGACFHTEREYLRLDTVEERVKMLTNFFSLL